MAEQMMQEAAGKAIPAGYQQTEVGVIPKDWEATQLGDLAEFVTSGSRGWAQFYSESGALFIRSQNVRDGKLNFDDIQYVKPPTRSEGSRTKVKRNDLLITITGNSVGNVALVDQDFDESYISQHVGLVRLKEFALGDYICRFLSPNAPGNQQITGSQSGQSKPGLNLKNLKDFYIAYPRELSELKYISSVLSDTDELISALEQLIAKKQAIKSATMQQLLTGRTRLPAFALRPDGTQKGYKPSELGDIPEDWDAYKFDDIFYKVSTKKNQITASEYMVHGIIPVVDQGKMIIVGYCDDIERMLKVDSSGVIVFGDHTCIIKYVDFNFIVGADGVQVIKGKVGFVTQFLYYAMLHLPIEPTGYNRHFSLLKESCYCIPAHEEQIAITTILSDMDSELTALEQKLAKARDVKQGMMQQLLTGRIRLPLEVVA
ncbi:MULTISPECIES: restriction endonuclease subunit S [Aeromonas]|uniref:restriction endonuclease subunit S n=1 Tax=Aeromonas hydrophila TaxID=644 RepID=UPI002B462441|nr:restriction endonuclease subunit S [Aeromonas hydrophila]